MIELNLHVKISRRRPKRERVPSDVPPPLVEYAEPRPVGFEPVEVRRPVGFEPVEVRRPVGFEPVEVRQRRGA